MYSLNVRPTIFATFIICISVIIPFHNEIEITYKFHAPYGQFIINDSVGPYVINVCGNRTFTFSVKDKEFIGGICAIKLTDPKNSFIEISDHTLKFPTSAKSQYFYVYRLGDNLVCRINKISINCPDGRRNI